jgi:hypothetical protein
MGDNDNGLFLGLKYHNYIFLSFIFFYNMEVFSEALKWCHISPTCYFNHVNKSV